MEMINTRRNAYGVSPPPLWLPQNMITPEQVIHHYHNPWGRFGGTGTVPSVTVPVLQGIPGNPLKRWGESVLIF